MCGFHNQDVRHNPDPRRIDGDTDRKTIPTGGDNFSRFELKLLMWRRAALT